MRRFKLYEKPAYLLCLCLCALCLSSCQKDEIEYDSAVITGDTRQTESVASYGMDMIVGPVTVGKRQECTYWYTGIPIDHPLWTWYCDNAIVISQAGNSITVRWDKAGTYNIYFYQSSLRVTVLNEIPIILD